MPEPRGKSSTPHQKKTRERGPKRRKEELVGGPISRKLNSLEPWFGNHGHLTHEGVRPKAQRRQRKMVARVIRKSQDTTGN